MITEILGVSASLSVSLSQKDFGSFMALIETGYKVSCTTTMMGTLQHMYNEQKDDLKEEIGSVKKKIASTTDYWSSRVQEGFMTVPSQEPFSFF